MYIVGKIPLLVMGRREENFEKPIWSVEIRAASLGFPMHKCGGLKWELETNFSIKREKLKSLGV